jgi:LysR family transcriptional regulator (chromosome initiation inhibitor)
MSVTLEFARTLAVVAAEGTIEAAARTLHLTPSAVSQRIRTLEEQLGRVLLVRSKPVRPTEAGAAIVRLGRQLDLLEREALAQLGDQPDADGTDGDRPDGESTPPRPTTVALAVNADSLGTWFLTALARAAQRRPLVFDLHRDDQAFTADLLESGTVMAAVTSQARPVSGCVVRPLGIMRYEPFATPAFVARWFAHGQDAEAFAAAPIVDFDRRDELQTQFVRSRGADPARPPRHYVPSSADFATAIALGLGWGMLPPQQSAPLLAEQRIVRLDGEAIGVPLFWQQWNLRSTVLTTIAEEVARAAHEALT